MEAAARHQLNEHLRRLKGGDRAAARFVFDALWAPCLGLARGLLRGQADADAKDAAQSALARLFEQAPSFDAARSGLGWALALVTWECRTLRKKRARTREDLSRDGVDGITNVNAAANAAGFGGDPLDQLVRAADVARVVDGFVALTEHDQSTLRALLDGDAAGDPALRKRRQRALTRLRALVLGTAADDDENGAPTPLATRTVTAAAQRAAKGAAKGAAVLAPGDPHV